MHLLTSLCVDYHWHARYTLTPPLRTLQWTFYKQTITKQYTMLRHVILYIVYFGKKLFRTCSNWLVAGRRPTFWTWVCLSLTCQSESLISSLNLPTSLIDQYYIIDLVLEQNVLPPLCLLWIVSTWYQPVCRHTAHTTPRKGMEWII